MHYLIFSTGLLLLTACSSKTPPPIQLEDTKPTTINHMLLEKPKNIIPKGVYLSETVWDAKMTIIKNSKYYFKNDKIIKAFYLAHHSDFILIKGDYDLINNYKNYLRRNGVKAKIELDPNPYSKYKSYKVHLWFSHSSLPVSRYKE